MNSTKNLFDPDTHFLNLAVVRLTLAAVICAALMMVIIIVAADRLTFEWSSSGLNNAVEIFRVPLGLLGVSIPVIALLAANHRSAQTTHQMDLTRNQIARTETQITLTRGQNEFSNYFKHQEEFVKRYKDAKIGSYSILSSIKLHGIIFPNARGGDFAVSPQVLEVLRQHLDEFVRRLKHFDVAETWVPALIAVNSHMGKLLGTLFIHEGTRSGVQLSDANGSYFFRETLQAFMIDCVHLYTLIDEVLEFGVGYETPAVLEKIINLPLGMVPAQRLDTTVMPQRVNIELILPRD